MPFSTHHLKSSALVAGWLALLGGAAMAAPAAAIDCTRAADAVDKALCGDASAKAADDAMAKGYEMLRASLDKAGAAQLLANQRSWLASRKMQCPGDNETEVACLVRWSEERRRDLAAEPTAGPGTSGRLVPAITFRKGAKGHWSIDSFLFRFADPRSPGQVAFNAAVDKAIAGLPDKMDGAGGGERGEWSQRGRLAWVSDRLISMKVEASEFATGAAHGMIWTDNINLDLQNAKPVTVDQLLAHGKLKDLADLCQKQVREQLIEGVKANSRDPASSADDLAGIDGEIKGMRPDLVKLTGDLTHWTFGKDGITIDYDQDAIAGHAAGAFTCRVSYRQLRPLSKVDAPLPGSNG